jgi:hypothetical protein
MKDFPRPKPVKVKIFGEEHNLHRLTRQDVLELAEVITNTLSETIMQMTDGGVAVADAVKAAISSGGPAMDTLLRLSFPTFHEWGELPMKYELALLDVIWDENDMGGIIEDFLALMGKMAKAGKRIASMRTS